ncbi:RusA family crossover junction endodeoxyribonuclease [bacterium]|nr:RusA family crossover junction endodeoxyribonuclease [bacterium]
MVRGEDPGLFPSVNHIYRKMRGGQQLTDMAKNHLLDWREMAQISWAEAGKNEPIKKKLVYVDAYFILPNNKVRDVSNVLKLLMDALEGVVYENDYYALPRIMDMRVVKDKARCYLEIRECDSNEEWLEKVNFLHV